MPTAVRVLLLADVSLALVYLLDFALGHPNWTLAFLVDMDREGNLPTWYSSSQLLLLGLLLGAFAFTGAVRRVSRSWPGYALAALCLALSFDEIAQIHENLGNRSDALFASGNRGGSLVSRTGLWMFLLGPPLVILVAFLWRAFSPSLRGSRRIARLYLVGFSVFAASALGIEFLSNFVIQGSPASTLQIAGEELGEMVGVTLLIWATLELLAAHGIRLRGGGGAAEFPDGTGVSASDLLRAAELVRLESDTLEAIDRQVAERGADAARAADL